MYYYNMDIIQGLIETGNADKLGWRIVNNNGVMGLYNNRTSNVSFSILNNGSVGTSSNIPYNIISSYSNINVITNYTSSSSSSGGSGGGSSQWTTAGTEIYYNLGNVGIGTIDPVAPLHIYSDTPLTIPTTLPTEISVVGATSTTIGTTERCIQFPYSGSGSAMNYSFIPTEALIADILVVGGGGAGGGNGGGGGGAGGYVYLTNIILNSGTTYNISVGRGGIGTYDNNTSGNNSSITGGTPYIALGGGRGGSRTSQASRNLPETGGSGGGGGGDVGAWGTGQASIQNSTYGYGVGFAGVNASFDLGANSAGGGGGGAGGLGTVGVNQLGGNGGNGVANTITGSSVIYCAGGGGGVTVNGSAGANGSSGNGSFGSGTKGGNSGTGASNGLNGIIIIRYRKATSNSSARLLLDTTTTGTAIAEFRRGTGADTQNDYRFINDTDGTIKLQVENSTQAFSNLSANLAWFSSNDTIIHKNTAINGRVGIGTVYHATRSLDVLGSANISGTVSVGGLSVLSSNAIITNSLSSNVSFTIHNGLIPPTLPSPTLITVSGATGGTIGDVDRTLLFTYTSGTFTTYTFTPTENLECDILVVGGGGGGGKFGGGGGGGAILFGTNITLNASSSVSIKVGNGGTGAADIVNSGINGVNGVDSSITISGVEYFAKGGGGGGSRAADVSGRSGSSGGSGGGGSHANGSPQGLGGVSNKITYSNFQSFGNNGGVGRPSTGSSAPDHASGGGGGAGSVGGDFSNSTGGGNGGAGLEFITYFGNGVGQSGWFAGGGGGNTYAGAGNGGYGNGGNGLLGGGGTGGLDGAEIAATSGLANTGGGGGGSKYDGEGSNAGGNGGSGIVIIRYRKPTTRTSSSIELIRGTTTDANRDYKLGNYNSEFKVISSTSGVDTDYIRITTAGAIFNPTGTASWNTGSDRRIKENIERASYDKCYDNINKLELNRFNYIEGFNTVSRDSKQLGFIAQEVKDIFPKAISSQGYYTDTLSIPDLLSIDVSQINYALYGAVKKLIEINKEKDERIKTLGYQLKTLETFLNIAVDTSNIVVDTSNITIDTSNIALDTSSNISIDTSNIALDTSNITLDTSNITIDTSNIILDTSSNIVIDTSNILDTSSNIILDTSNISIDTSNITIDTSNIIDTSSNIVMDTSNIALDTSNTSIDTSNITIDTSNITIDTSNILDTSSNIVIDTSNITIDTSNIVIDTSNISIDTSNISIDTSNITIDTSNIAIDTSNISIDTSNISIDTSNIILDTSSNSS
jgi:hypothetical protein